MIHSLEGISRISIPLQLAASTVVTGFVFMKVGSAMGGEYGGAFGLIAGLMVGFFGYLVIIIKREQ
jgi:hypothetical protein